MHATTADSPGVAGLKYALGRIRLQNSGKSSQGIPSFSPPSLHQLLSSDSLQANLLRKCKFPSHWELFYTSFLHKEQPHIHVKESFFSRPAFLRPTMQWKCLHQGLTAAPSRLAVQCSSCHFMFPQHQFPT